MQIGKNPQMASNDQIRFEITKPLKNRQMCPFQGNSVMKVFHMSDAGYIPIAQQSETVTRNVANCFSRRTSESNRNPQHDNAANGYSLVSTINSWRSDALRAWAKAA